MELGDQYRGIRSRAVACADGAANRAGPLSIIEPFFFDMARRDLALVELMLVLVRADQCVKR
jgi:hypothetical protein